MPALDAQSPATCFTITNAIERARRNDLPLQRLRFLRNETRPDAGMEPNPWSAGYALARQLRQNLELDDGPIPTLKSLAEAIGEDLALLRKATRPVWPRDGQSSWRTHGFPAAKDHPKAPAPPPLEIPTKPRVIRRAIIRELGLGEMSDLPEDDAEACIDVQRIGSLLFRRR